jgi:hypothetical protein
MNTAIIAQRLRTAQQFSDAMQEIDDITCLENCAADSTRKYQRTGNLEHWYQAERYQREADALKAKYDGGWK